MGIEKLRTCAYHPQANGAIERWHRSLKTALMCRGNTDHWFDELPTVLLGLRTTLRDDTKTSAAEMVYGEVIRLPGDFFKPLKQEISEDHSFLRDLRDKITKLSSIPKKELTQGKIFVHPELQNSSYVFVRTDVIQKSLTPPYTGPYKVIERNDKYFKILYGDTEKNISIDRLKPAFTLATDSIPNVASNTTPAHVPYDIKETTPARVIRSRRPVVRFNCTSLC